MVVVNKPGGGGTLALTECYKAKPDGYTIILADVQPMLLNALTSDVEYQPLKFRAIGQTNGYTRVMETNPKTIPEIDTWEEFMDNIYDLKVATVGFGSGPHIGTVVLGNLSGCFDPDKLNLVHYDGTAEAIAGFQRGEVDVMIGAVESHFKYVPQGILNFLVVFSDEPHPMIPDVPTSGEAGIPNAEEINLITYAFAAFYAPPETPDIVLDALEASLKKAIEDPESRKDQEKANRPLVFKSREEIAKLTQDLYQMWSEQEAALEIMRGG